MTPYIALLAFVLLLCAVCVVAGFFSREIWESFQKWRFRRQSRRYYRANW